MKHSIVIFVLNIKSCKFSCNLYEQLNNLDQVNNLRYNK